MCYLEGRTVYRMSIQIDFTYTFSAARPYCMILLYKTYDGTIQDLKKVRKLKYFSTFKNDYHTLFKKTFRIKKKSLKV